MVKVKVCGITNLQDALAAVKAGADALGFVFYKESFRYISPQKARNIIRRLPKNIIKAGVFVDTEEKEIRKIADLCRLDLLQFHGRESAQFCRRFCGYKVVKAFRVAKEPELKDILKYKTFAYLFDAFDSLRPGGTGKKFNWELVKKIRADIKRPLFLSGGLNYKNIKEALRILRPDWVDVSSSIEKSPGKKDALLMEKFIAVLKPGS
jgi:phosphoribosylanthranilate isomerase